MLSSFVPDFTLCWLLSGFSPGDKRDSPNAPHGLPLRTGAGDGAGYCRAVRGDRECWVREGRVAEKYTELFRQLTPANKAMQTKTLLK
jgi:hypothetical protein